MPNVLSFTRLAEPLSIVDAAHALGVSERTLRRTTTAVVGMSPVGFIQEVRVDEATFLLRTTTLSAEAIAARVGYLNSGTLRALVRRRRGTSLENPRRGTRG